MIVSAKKMRTQLEPIGDVFVQRVGARDVRLYFAKINKLIAEQLIDSKNGNNRDVNNSQVDRLVEEMSSGHWRTNHQGIAFDLHGNLMDGQHRLIATAEAGVEWVGLVSEGWEYVVRVSIDGVYARQLKDALKIMGTTAHPTLVAMSLIAIRRHIKRTSVKVGFDTAREMIDKHRSGINWACTNIGNAKRTPLMSSTFVAVFVYAYPAMPDLINQAWDDFQTGVDLADDDPIYFAREFFLKPTNRFMMRGPDGRQKAFEMVMAALHKRACGQSVKALRPSAESWAFFAKANGKANGK
jgi:hypothetical protein